MHSHNMAVAMLVRTAESLLRLNPECRSRLWQDPVFFYGSGAGVKNCEKLDLESLVIFDSSRILRGLYMPLLSKTLLNFSSSTVAGV